MSCVTSKIASQLQKEEAQVHLGGEPGPLILLWEAGLKGTSVARTPQRGPRAVPALLSAVSGHLPALTKGRKLSKNTITYPVAVLATALAIAACGTATGKDKPASTSNTPVPLGSSNQVSSKGDWNSDGYEGTVTVSAKPVVCTEPDDTRVLLFHVQAYATKGAVPTGYWKVQTGNATQVENSGVNINAIGGPPLGSPVTAEAKGDIAFVIEPKTTPTTLELHGEHPIDPTIAQWSIGDLPPATACPASVQITTPGYHR